jgi:hypothetical protein
MIKCTDAIVLHGRQGAGLIARDSPFAVGASHAAQEECEEMTPQQANTSKRISPNAYQALREALAVIFWYKRPFESYLRDALSDHPELLSGLNFGDLKRHVADALVSRLRQHEDRYQQVTLNLMVEIATMERFPDLEKHEDQEIMVAEARSAVAELRRWTEQYASVLEEEERRAAGLAAARQQAEATRKFSDDLDELRQEFMALWLMSDAQARGRKFEPFLNKLFALFDMEPRLAYSLEHEQIDGSLSFDTDDYILEARWWKGPVERKDADVLATKVRRKGKNALGMFISVNGFSEGALTSYSESTPFIAMDGQDLMYVLEQRLRLDDLLRRKKRYANETGHCFLPATTVVTG